MMYFLLKLLHIIAVILFLGNIITGHFWMHIAVRSKDVRIISHTINGVIHSDRLFTVPGVVFIVAAGLTAAILGNLPILRTGWIFWSIILFTLSGVVFTRKLAPLQKKLQGLVANVDAIPDTEWIFFKGVYIEWKIWGFIALAMPAAALVMMILKIPR